MGIFIDIIIILASIGWLLAAWQRLQIERYKTCLLDLQVACLKREKEWQTVIEALEKLESDIQARKIANDNHKHPSNRLH